MAYRAFGGLVAAFLTACIFQYAILFAYRLPEGMSAADTLPGLLGAVPVLIVGFLLGWLATDRALERLRR